ncbi:hypothetical protein JCM1840_000470 [Sporobolomyces johnsonii]
MDNSGRLIDALDPRTSSLAGFAGPVSSPAPNPLETPFPSQIPSFPFVGERSPLTAPGTYNAQHLAPDPLVEPPVHRSVFERAGESSPRTCDFAAVLGRPLPLALPLPLPSGYPHGHPTPLLTPPALPAVPVVGSSSRPSASQYAFPEISSLAAGSLGLIGLPTPPELDPSLTHGLAACVVSSPSLAGPSEWTSPPAIPPHLDALPSPPPLPFPSPAPDPFSPLSPNIKPFIGKLVHLLARPDLYADVVMWCPDGLAFIVNATDHFRDKVLPDLFGHGNFASFTRQLNVYSFTRMSTTDLIARVDVGSMPAASAWHHPLFRRDDPSTLHLLSPRPSRARLAKRAEKRERAAAEAAEQREREGSTTEAVPSGLIGERGRNNSINSLNSTHSVGSSTSATSSSSPYSTPGCNSPWTPEAKGVGAGGSYFGSW